MEKEAVSVSDNLAKVLNQIKDACINAGRVPTDVKLVAVSKFHPAEAVKEAIKAGQTLFGENRVQEASGKFDEVRKEYPSAELHIIGQLQRNKVKEAVRVASCIESVDRIELLDEIEKQCAKIDKKIDILFELHTGEESKSGFESVKGITDALDVFKAGKYPHIIPTGFMTMAPLTEDKEIIRKSFKTLKECREQLKEKYPEYPLNELSMGMSCDFEIAIEEGSTMVRIGTAIFGHRDYGAKAK